MDYRDSSEGALRAIELPPPLDRKMSLDEQLGGQVHELGWISQDLSSSRPVAIDSAALDGQIF